MDSTAEIGSWRSALVRRVLESQEPRACQDFCKRQPRHELHDEKISSVGVLGAEERGDRGVIERGQRLRLALEPRDALGIRSELLQDDFDRDVAVEATVARLIDDAHASRTESFEDLVRAEMRRRSVFHRAGVYDSRRSTKYGAEERRSTGS